MTTREQRAAEILREEKDRSGFRSHIAAIRAMLRFADAENARYAARRPDESEVEYAARAAWMKLVDTPGYFPPGAEVKRYHTDEELASAVQAARAEEREVCAKAIEVEFYRRAMTPREFFEEILRYLRRAPAQPSAQEQRPDHATRSVTGERSPDEGNLGPVSNWPETPGNPRAGVASSAATASPAAPLASAAQPAKEGARCEWRDSTGPRCEKSIGHDGPHFITRAVPTFEAGESTPPAPTDAEVLEAAAKIMARELGWPAGAMDIRARDGKRVPMTDGNDMHVVQSIRAVAADLRAAPAEEPKAKACVHELTDCPQCSPAPPAASEADDFFEVAREFVTVPVQSTPALAALLRARFGECVEALESAVERFGGYAKGDALKTWEAGDVAWLEEVRSALSSLRARRGGS